MTVLLSCFCSEKIQDGASDQSVAKKLWMEQKVSGLRFFNQFKNWQLHQLQKTLVDAICNGAHSFVQGIALSNAKLMPE